MMESTTSELLKIHLKISLKHKNNLKIKNMKIKHIVLAASILVSVSSFAQKDELKALKKIYAKEEIKAADLVEYKSLVAKVEPLATEEGDKVYAAFYKTMTPVLESLAID